MSVLIANHTLDPIQFTFQTLFSKHQRHQIDGRDEPGDGEPVEHVSKVARIHEFSVYDRNVIQVFALGGLGCLADRSCGRTGRELKKMEHSENRRAKARVKRFLGPYLDLSYKHHGTLETMRARVLDSSDSGVGLSGLSPLAPGTIVSFVDDGTAEAVTARVARCHKTATGDYRIGLEREAGVGAKADGNADYYELLQLNPKADPDTIHRVYRILAQRYHPDNKETGDAVLFRRLLEAYAVLTDPEKRAVYDLSLHSIRQHTWKVFESPEAARPGARSEKQKRHAVLWALYMKRARDNYQPAMLVTEFEDLLGIPKEHLEFTVWYLKESGLVTRTDANRMLITVKGVDVAELWGDPAVTKQVPEDRKERLLETA